MKPEPLPAVILAGGNASRMGGAKDARLLAGKTLLRHVLACITPQCGPIALNANEDPDRFAPYGLPILPDSIPERPGPLAGILAAMDWAAELGCPRVLTVPTDTPFLPPDLVSRLHENAGPEQFCLAASAPPDGQTRIHPTCGIWPTRLRGDLRNTLKSGQRKVMGFARTYSPASAVWTYAAMDPFFNINSPADLVRAEALFSASAKAGTKDCHHRNP
ncbi:molybdenum cofactor guanylyltransferase MobA [Paracoccus onubensis]|uniref:Molybdenum cofactor guanylyltransferase n=1 Tax=Paracoccus onubensis TaxID=1675788 RepID=A0A418T2E1_9RHOB|nr:molybdenum cofactor guanylyltransferase MobA [Paracoccus onubensis]RJE87356.1 molybdenum cofactor guanylyltransferase MobA [Paracoccus onubensis]